MIFRLRIYESSCTGSAEFINEVLKPSEEQQEMVSAFSERAESVRGGLVNPTEDNMLKITNDGRKMLDQRLLNELLPMQKKQGQYCGKMLFCMGRRKSRPDNSADLLRFIHTCAEMGHSTYMMMSEQTGCQRNPERRDCFLSMNTTWRQRKRSCLQRCGLTGENPCGSTPKLGAGTNVQG